MSSLVTSRVRSALGKITRAGLDTRRSRPPASTIFSAVLPGVTTSLRPVQAEQDDGQVVFEGVGALGEQLIEHPVDRLLGRLVEERQRADLWNQLVEPEAAEAPQRPALREPIGEQHDRRFG